MDIAGTPEIACHPGPDSGILSGSKLCPLSAVEPMKRNILFMIVSLLTIPAAASPFELPTGEVTIKAVDEERNPVAGAKVTITFQPPVPKWGGGSGINIEGNTDFSGEFTAAGHSFDTLGGSVRKEGFYTTWPEAAKFSDAIDGKWQPWNPTIEAVLKKIGHPVPMYARRLDVQIPVVDQPVGFDLAESDWLSPYGKGKTPDFVFQLKRRFVSRQDYEASVKLSFSNDGDGIQPAVADDKGMSALRLPRTAPDSGYLSEWNYSWGSSEHPAFENRKEHAGSIFRVRTAKNGDKNEGALYGKIDGTIGFDAINSKTAWVIFTYYLNPTANDRNLEYDPMRDLLVDLKEEERVKSP